MRLLVLLTCAFTLGWLLSARYHDAIEEPFVSGAFDSALEIGSEPENATDTAARTTSANAPPAAQSAPSVFDNTLALLERGDFEAVMAEYPFLQSSLSPRDAAEHRKIILDHADSLRKSGRETEALELLDRYLELEYRDISALLLLARVYQDAGNEMDAIEILFQARAHAGTPASIKQTDRAIRTTVRSYSWQLQERKDFIARLNLYQRLTELEPEHTLNFIGLAETYLALGNADDARKALALTQHDSSVQERADEVLRRIETRVEAPATEKRYAVEVQMRPAGNQFMVDAVLNNTQVAVLLLDTGASLSIISQRMLDALNLPSQSIERVSWFSTAGGRIRAPVVRLDRLALDDVAVEYIEVGVIDEFDNYRFDGLLGMNFLQHFEFYIDQAEASLQLNPHGG